MATGLLRKQHATAYEGVVRWLQSDPALRRSVGAWRAWDGSDDDAAPAAVDSGITLRITPELGPSEPMASNGTTRVWSRPLDLSFECDVAGSKAADTLDLADAIFARLFPQDPDTLAALNAKLETWGVMELIELQPASIRESSTQMTVSAGRVRLEMWMSG